MSNLIRPEAREALWRWREVLAAAGVAGFGLWLMALGGYLLGPIGALVIALAVVLGVLGLRRLRFAQTGDAPGVVEVDEGQISYFGPAFGGAVSTRELVELRLVTSHGRRLWRLRQNDGQTLLIPVEAVGAEALFDAFSALPGMNTQTLVAALDAKPGRQESAQQTLSLATDSRVIWQRSACAVLT